MSELIKEDTKIELKPDEAALIINRDGTNLQIVLPKLSDEEDLPLPIQFLAAVAMLAKENNEFVDSTLDKFYTLLEKNTDWSPNDNLDKVESTVESKPKEVKASITIKQVDEDELKDIDGVGC